MTKTVVYMNETNIDWTARFTDGEERSIFNILKNNKSQRATITMQDDALQKFVFGDFTLSELKEIQLVATVEINGEAEKQVLDFIYSGGHWDVIRAFYGAELPIEIAVNEADTINNDYFSIDIIGSGSGNDTAQINIFARSKLTS